jgi:hypothetical protein
VALFATWSMLSNILAAFILLLPEILSSQASSMT